MSSMTTPPLSLYVHLPWCERKCPYCDFNSYEARGPIREQAYVDALLADLDFELRDRQPAGARRLESIFIGGGTPSLFSGDSIRRLIEGIRERCAVPADCEVTLEANPGSAEARRFADYLAAGVTRLSIGVQSFRDDKLRRLGRVHDAAEAVHASEIARGAGFSNFNIDLMYALPDDDLAGSLYDLEVALDQQPAHISWYQLTLEPDTAFHRRPPALPEEDAVIEIEMAGRGLLTHHGYVRYEVSGYARRDRRCRHNLNYWQFGDYIGIGAGAHGKLTTPAGAIERRARARNPNTYLATAGSAAAVTSQVTGATEEIVVEFLMNALRLVDGVDTALFEARTGASREHIAPARGRAEARGWLDPDPERLRATPTGLQMLNRLLALF